MGRKRRVLVLDDDPTTRLLASSVIQDLDCEFSGAASGELGLIAVNECVPDLILLDVTLPGMSGFDVLKALKAEPRTAKILVLMLTKMDDNESIRRAFHLGANDFFTKPINWTVLGHRVRYMLRGLDDQEALRSSEKRLLNAQRISQMADWELDLRSGRFIVSSQLRKFFKLGDEADFQDTDEFCGLFHQSEQADLAKALRDLIENQQAFVLDHKVSARGENDRVFRHYGEVLRRDDQGVPETLIGCLQDITARKLDEARIHQLAYFDSATGLANRTQFVAQVEAACGRASKEGLRPAVILLDLNRFKYINDTMGYQVGDEVLGVIATRISESLRNGVASPFFASRGERDCLARLGGDEFGVLLSDVADLQQVEVIASRIQSTVAEPLCDKARNLRLSAGFGVALYQCARDEAVASEDHASFASNEAAKLMMHAEIAMYRAKSQPEKPVVTFDESMNVDLLMRVDLETDLRLALQRDEMFLQYQPKVDLASGQICGLEALIRWKHPRSGLVPPNDFIGIAEQVGLIIPIGHWVLDAVCKQLVEWRSAGMSLVPVAVNLATPHVRQTDLPSELSILLRKYDLDASLLQIEVTESLMMDEPEACLNTLHSLRDIGIEIAIDDFGVGYSSLSYLKRLPISVLKIDRSFVRDITSDPDDAAITAAILAMAHQLGIKVVAEGVETLEQLEFLRALNCQQYQGYYFSKPVMPEQIVVLIEEQSMREPAETLTIF